MVDPAETLTRIGAAVIVASATVPAALVLAATAVLPLLDWARGRRAGKAPR